MVTPASPGRRPADWSCIWPRQLANSCSPSEGMEISVFHEHMRKIVRQVVTVSFAGAAALGLGPAGAGIAAAAGSLPAPVPAVTDYQYLSASTTPPAESDCTSVGRRCFTSASMQASYNLPPLYAANEAGQGMTIGIIDSFGNPNMCGEPGVTCTAGMPTFQHVYWNGVTQVKAPPPGSNGAGSQTRNIWALETSLDVEWAHSIAPEANILLMTTNPAETLGVQGFPATMNCSAFIVDHHEAT